MPAEVRHHLSGPLEIAAALAFSAGSVDAFVFQNVTPVFVANMSGNLIRFGIATGTTSGTAMAIEGLALACFVLGAFVATLYVDRQIVGTGDAHPRHLLAAESVLLVTMLVLVGVTHTGFRESPSGTSFAVVAAGALAMGMQAVSIRRVGTVAVSTTYGTGALVRFGEKAALGLRRAHHEHAVRRRHSMVVIAAVLASYVAGAAVAAALPADTWVLVIPVVITAACGLVPSRAGS